jgi:hypothetical protein
MLLSLVISGRGTHPQPSSFKIVFSGGLWPMETLPRSNVRNGGHTGVSSVLSILPRASGAEIIRGQLINRRT